MSTSQRDARFLDLIGAHNFRRVEGWTSNDGRRLRANRLYRSSGLEELTQEDARGLSKLGIARTFDLRSDAERTRLPSRWHEAAEPAVWTGADCAAAADLSLYLDEVSGTPEELTERLRRLYAAFPEELSASVAAVLERMLDTPQGGILIHCAAGKDRTGFVVAAVLRALDIREADIHADYLLTNETYDAARDRFSNRHRLAELEQRAPGSLAVLLGAHADYLASADAAVAERWGSYDGYFNEAVGFNAAQRERLRDLYLEPA